MNDDREAAIRKEYGELLSLTNLAKVLNYPSIQAVQKARLRGRLGLPVLQVPGRRGWFATAKAVGEYLNALDQAPLPVGAGRRAAIHNQPEPEEDS